MTSGMIHIRNIFIMNQDLKKLCGIKFLCLGESEYRETYENRMKSMKKIFKLISRQQIYHFIVEDRQQVLHFLSLIQLILQVLHFVCSTRQLLFTQCCPGKPKGWIPMEHAVSALPPTTTSLALVQRMTAKSIHFSQIQIRNDVLQEHKKGEHTKNFKEMR